MTDGSVGLTLEQLIAMVPEDYDFLIRTGRPGFYPLDTDAAFCHLHHKNAISTSDGMVGHSVKIYAATSAAALLTCLTELGVSMVAQ
jgi:hypothetical protein